MLKEPKNTCLGERDEKRDKKEGGEKEKEEK